MRSPEYQCIIIPVENISDKSCCISDQILSLLQSLIEISLRCVHLSVIVLVFVSPLWLILEFAREYGGFSGSFEWEILANITPLMLLLLL